MKTRMIVLAAIVGLTGSSLLAGTSVSGKYVEARTAEVFTGGCIMGSEAETVGKQAVLAWKVDRGSYNGISLDGLSVVAAVAGDRNLGIVEIGGAKANIRSSVFVDDRANAAQRIALVAMATELSKGIFCQQTRGAKCFERSPGVGLPDCGMLGPETQLERLHEKLDVHLPARPALDVARAAACLQPLAHCRDFSRILRLPARPK